MLTREAVWTQLRARWRYKQECRVPGSRLIRVGKTSDSRAALPPDRAGGGGKNTEPNDERVRRSAPEWLPRGSTTRIAHQ